MPIYFQSLRTVGPDMVFTAIIIAQIYFLTSANNLSRPFPIGKYFLWHLCLIVFLCEYGCVSLASLFPLIFVLQYLRNKVSGLGIKWSIDRFDSTTNCLFSLWRSWI